MKKIILILSILLLTACSISNDDISYDSYYEIKDTLASQSEFAQEYPFNVKVIFNEIDDYYRYDVVIDEPQENMYNIVSMAYCDEDNTTCPVIGLFDDEPYHLIVDVIDKENNYYKGIQLSGTTSKKTTIKIYISYYLDENNTDFQDYYIEVNNS